MTRPRPSASFLKSAEASAAAQRHRTGRMATSRAHVRLAASAPTSTVLASRDADASSLRARPDAPRGRLPDGPPSPRFRGGARRARAPRGSPEPPLRVIRALHPPRRFAIISRSASASWPLGPGGPAPDPRNPRPDHDDVSIPEWALIQIPRVGDDESARTTPEETESEPNGERETHAHAWRGSSPLAALSGAFATTTTTTTTMGFAARMFAPRAAVVAVFAAAVVAAAHLFGAGAGVASPIVASITPVVFLTHGATVSHAAAMVAQGLHAWATNVVGVAATAAASAAPGAAGYAAARRAAAAELAELRAELTAALRRMVAETAAIAMVGGEDRGGCVG